MEMEIPKPGPAHEILARLSGHWEGPETMMPSPWSPEEETRHGVIRVVGVEIHATRHHLLSHIQPGQLLVRVSQAQGGLGE